MLSSIEAGATATLAKLVAGALGATAIALAALVHGKGGRTGFDLACLASAAIGLALWAMTDEPATALALFLAADLIGALPILRATWQKPADEACFPWLLAALASLLNLAAVGDAQWLANGDGFAIWGVAVYLAALDLTMVALIMRRWASPSCWPVWPAVTIRTRQ